MDVCDCWEKNVEMVWLVWWCKEECGVVVLGMWGCVVLRGMWGCGIKNVIWVCVTAGRRTWKWCSWFGGCQQPNDTHTQQAGLHR